MHKTIFIVQEVFKETEISKKNKILKKTILSIFLDSNKKKEGKKQAVVATEWGHNHERKC